MKKRLIIFISGSGSNLQVLLDACASGELNAEPVLVVSNRKAAYGLVRAAQAGVPTLYHALKPYRDAGKTRQEYEADLAKMIRPLNPDLLILVGWMHIFGEAFVQEFPNQIINLHPALPGQFDGTHAIERAFEAYQKGEIEHSGCMVHYAIPKVDAGQVIMQANVPIYPVDTLEDFEERMHAKEHEIIVQATKRLTES